MLNALIGKTGEFCGEWLRRVKMCDYGYVSDLLGDPVDNAAGSASAQANDSEAYQNSGAYQLIFSAEFI